MGVANKVLALSKAIVTVSEVFYRVALCFNVLLLREREREREGSADAY